MKSIQQEKNYQNTIAYTLFGMAFGLSFPVIATFFDMSLSSLPFSLESIVKVQLNNPLHWIIDTAPFFLGSAAAFAGYSKDQVVNLNLGLEKKIEERTEGLKKKNKELTEAKELAEAGARAKTQFLSTMSHEIRTPLNAVIGMSGLLSDTELNREQQDFVHTINKSGENLLGIINNILDYAKIESGKFELEEFEFSIAHLIEDILDLISATEFDKHIELIYHIDEEVPDFVVGDITRIQQVLVNLVRNAIKFTDQGEIVIHVGKRAEDKDRVSLVFQVKDTGVGIPDEKQDRLFQLFSQVDASTTRKYGGTGLGLAICKRLVELMGGSISVESVFGKGSTFEFNVSLKSSSKTLKTFKTINLQGKSVFILDDNDTNLVILKSQCEKAGMQVETFQDPLEVLEDVEVLKEFDLGILDMQMPEKNGIQVSEVIRGKYSKGELPLILLSSIMDLGNIEDRKKFNLYLTKPVKQTHLLHNLERVLGNVEKSIKSKEKSTSLILDRKMKILLAEDNVINQKVASKMLERLGQACDVAGNGKEAVEMCKLITYDLVLMDMEMPEMDGLQATQAIRKSSKENQSMIIIAMTANAMEEDKKRCLAAGMNDFISKPVKLEALHESIYKWFPDKAEEKTKPVIN